MSIDNLKKRNDEIRMNCSADAADRPDETPDNHAGSGRDWKGIAKRVGVGTAKTAGAAAVLISSAAAGTILAGHIESKFGGGAGGE